MDSVKVQNILLFELTVRLSTIRETVDRRLSYRTGPVCLIERVSERPLCSGNEYRILYSILYSMVAGHTVGRAILRRTYPFLQENTPSVPLPVSRVQAWFPEADHYSIMRHGTLKSPPAPKKRMFS